MMGVGITAVLIAAAYLGYLLITQETAQQARQPFTETIEPWTLTCQKSTDESLQLSCAASQQIVDQSSNQVIFIWTIGYSNNGEFISVFRGGNRLLPKQPINIVFNQNTAFAANNSVCNGQFCEYLRLMTDDFQKALIENENVLIMMKSSQGKDVQLPVNLGDINKILTSIGRKK